MLNIIILKRYRNKIWDILKSFASLNLMVVLKYQNNEVDALAQKGLKVDPTHHWLKGKGIQLIFKPFVPKNDYL